MDWARCWWLCLLLCSCVSGPNPKDTRQAEIQYDLGVGELKAGHVPDALRNFMEAAEANPNFPQAQNGLGLAYYMLGDYPKALFHLKHALEIKPDYCEVMNTIARVHISQGQFREAIPYLRKALDDVFLPERYLAESNLGWALFKVGETEEGFKRVKNALAQNDHYCVGYEYLGMMHQIQGDLESATRYLQKLVEYCPKYPQGHLHLGKLMLMKSDVPAGCGALDTCRQLGGMTNVGQDCDRLYRNSCPAVLPQTSPAPTPSDKQESQTQ
jgi:type IV pilus assembly protein PilF